MTTAAENGSGHCLPTQSLGHFVWITLLLGCGSAPYQIAQVSGRVTLDGDPLAGCQIRFQPVSGSNSNINPGPGAFAVTDGDGRFALRTINPQRPGAVVGKHRVWLTTVTEADASTESGVFTAEKVPPRYRMGRVDFEVPVDGTDQANFDLTSK